MWQPTASIENLRARARIIQNIRGFFAARNVLEVETPLLCHTSVTDPHIHSITAETGYLQTSPEYAMKRLLAAGSGAIFQISKAFRKDEAGRLHNPEFTMLEWYRPGFTHLDLMTEVDALLQHILMTAPATLKTYRELFLEHLHIDPHLATLSELTQTATTHFTLNEPITDRDTCLHLLMSHCIEPQLGNDKPCIVYDYPASQAALAKIQATEPPVASRFEVYFKGIELANGFHELQDANEQRKRFEYNIAQRKALSYPFIPLDECLLAALAAGLPDCAGVALGVDRLIMLALECQHINQVLSFSSLHSTI